MPIYASRPQREALIEVAEMINHAAPGLGETCLKLILGILDVSMDGGPVQDLTFKGGDIHLVPCLDRDQNTLIQPHKTSVSADPSKGPLVDPLIDPLYYPTSEEQVDVRYEVRN